MRLHVLPSTSKSFVMNKKNGFHALPSTSNKFVMNKREGFEVLGLASCHNKDRYVTVISRDIRMYCGRFVGPSHTIHGWSPCLKSKNWTNVGCKLWFFERVVRKTDKAAISALFLFQIPRVSRGLHTHTHTKKKCRCFLF